MGLIIICRTWSTARRRTPPAHAPSGAPRPDQVRNQKIERSAVDYVRAHFGSDAARDWDSRSRCRETEGVGYAPLMTKGDCTLCVEDKGRSSDEVAADFSRGESRAVLGAVERVLRALPELEIAAQEMIEKVLSPKSRSASTENSRRKAMCAALVRNHPRQPRVHPLRGDEFAFAAPRQQRAERSDFQLLGIHPLTQQVDRDFVCKNMINVSPAAIPR